MVFGIPSRKKKKEGGMYVCMYVWVCARHGVIIALGLGLGKKVVMQFLISLLTTGLEAGWFGLRGSTELHRTYSQELVDKP